LIARLHLHSVELIVHAVDQKAQKLLGVLLPVTRELRHCLGHLAF
jgi:hypothetical protein